MARDDAPNPNRVVLRHLDVDDLRYVELQTRSVANARLQASTYLSGGGTIYSVVAAPALVAIKIGLSGYMRKRTEQSSVELTAVSTLIAPTPDMIPRLPSATSA
ncbi:MAG: hypothetical protein EOS11_00540 [Mesorhizobium sp.]|uniref:hypothetical protein n=1 Tax=Mesorhizobium sp. TaxID=1871066 RepID=UPI000FE36B9A|nr:hypothetical protein [Mesorhizobium sp.]RWN63125.1 MAG: hypothetical protein EOS00_04590 [Mesorhizobium sp.]RWO31859.1 MAG: hypothetical protein EOS10_12620 [Mesorhizobium sp.]RWO50670.1 MAG: hypothetical protein EOS11_00540 [Mesorhizobium sp.]TIN79598.1 MAG: hypothetical protein E5Y09_09330 [Mesorhizobium sp.]